MGINRFTDLSAEEMREYKGLDRRLAHSRRAGMPSYDSHEDEEDLVKDLPESVDWRDAGLMMHAYLGYQCC